MEFLDYNGLAYYKGKTDQLLGQKVSREELAFVSKRFKWINELMSGQKFDIDNNTGRAYELDVPVGAKVLGLNSIGGASRKGYQLFNQERYTANKRISVSSGGMHDSNGFGVSDKIAVSNGQPYTLITGVQSYYAFYDLDKKYVSGGVWANETNKSFQNDGYISFDFPLANIESVIFEKGTVAHDWEPYTPDIIHAPVSEVVCKGKNLFDKNNYDKQQMYIQTGVSVVGVASDYRCIVIPITDISPYTITKTLESNVLRATFVKEYPIRTQTPVGTVFNATSPFNKVTAIPTAGDKYLIVQLYANNNTYTDVSYYADGLMIEKGTSATEFTPYRDPVHKPLPQPLLDFLADKGYGWSACDVYNELDLERKQYIQRVSSVDLGTYTYVRYKNDKYDYMRTTTQPMKPVPTNILPNILCSVYETKITAGIYSGADVGIGVSDIGRIAIGDTTSTADEIKNALQGVMLYYELAEPITYDISSYLADFDDLVEVEGGGSVTFAQGDSPYRLEVPYNVDFAISLAEIGG